MIGSKSFPTVTSSLNRFSTSLKTSMTPTTAALSPRNSIAAISPSTFVISNTLSTDFLVTSTGSFAVTSQTTTLSTGSPLAPSSITQAAAIPPITLSAAVTTTLATATLNATGLMQPSTVATATTSTVSSNSTSPLAVVGNNQQQNVSIGSAGIIAIITSAVTIVVGGFLLWFLVSLRKSREGKIYAPANYGDAEVTYINMELGLEAPGEQTTPPLPLSGSPDGTSIPSPSQRLTAPTDTETLLDQMLTRQRSLARVNFSLPRGITDAASAVSRKASLSKKASFASLGRKASFMSLGRKSSARRTLDFRKSVESMGTLKLVGKGVGIATFRPTSDDEVPLAPGQRVHLYYRYADGWVMGRVVETDQLGFFPALSFARRANHDTVKGGDLEYPERSDSLDDRWIVELLRAQGAAESD
ncbi:hypothetical protein HDU93_007672 [Gonapodya sp. JEL0774]|nr:hypothetical protein HDU93_007672 [Gonapodya sp. JEL0774]